MFSDSSTDICLFFYFSIFLCCLFYLSESIFLDDQKKISSFVVLLSVKTLFVQFIPVLWLSLSECLGMHKLWNMDHLHFPLLQLVIIQSLVNGMKRFWKGLGIIFYLLFPQLVKMQSPLLIQLRSIYLFIWTPVIFSMKIYMSIWKLNVEFKSINVRRSLWKRDEQTSAIVCTQKLNLKRLYCFSIWI